MNQTPTTEEMEDCRLTWDKPMTSKQAGRYLLTKGFVAAELYEKVKAEVERLQEEHRYDISTMDALAEMNGRQISRAEKAEAELAAARGKKNED